MNYNWCFPYINKDKIKCIFELGSRDCNDSVTLYKEFNCPVIAFECNPECINECKKTLSTVNYPITLITKAVHEENKIVQFRPFNREKYDNIGASSLFEIDFITNRASNDGDYGKKDVQHLINVEAIRLDKFIDESNTNPDLICMDIQEAELIALKGLGDKIKDVKYIVFEASIVGTYTGGCTFMDVHTYLETHNFKFVKSSLHNGEFPQKYSNTFSFCDCLYINTLF
jgi:FkbM family methyltransferase